MHIAEIIFTLFVALVGAAALVILIHDIRRGAFRK